MADKPFSYLDQLEDDEPPAPPPAEVKPTRIRATYRGPRRVLTPAEVRQELLDLMAKYSIDDTPF